MGFSPVPMLGRKVRFCFLSPLCQYSTIVIILPQFILNSHVIRLLGSGKALFVWRARNSKKFKKKS